ncbi:MAG TPA: HRDC domain-containing protein [Dehalococcoidia bacterium]|nr:HRDC domain-containing protein [Dehalococcoidia bacterium]
MAPSVVHSAGALAEAAASLGRETSIAVDTEADSLHSYWHQTCLLQISSPEHDYVIDPLAVDPAPLGSLFANPAVEKIMHAGENDVRVLKRDFAFAFTNLFDTMVAARILGYPRWGLADLLRDAFDVELDKRYQRYDWAQRPLPPEVLHYAAMDTHHLPALREKLGRELHIGGHDEEAAEEFARIAATPPAERGFDPEDFWRVKGAYDLEPAQRPALRELHRFRDEQARRLNRPPFRVMPDQTLIAVAKAAPHTQQELEKLAGVSPFIAQRYGRALLAAVQRAAGRPPIRAERNARPDEATLARYDALRAWRNARAAQRKVEGDVIVANSVLRALAAAPPADRPALEASGLLGPWKLRNYGDEVLAVLRSTPR